MRPAVFAAALLTTAVAAPVAHACTVSMGWEAWPPYQFINADGKLTGLDIELVEAMGRSAGCTVQWRESPWARQLAEMESGQLTGVPAASRTAEREAFSVFTQPYRTESVHLMRKAGARPETIAELAAGGRRIGVVNETFYGDEVARLMADPATAAAFEKVANDDSNLRKLAAGRLDAVVTDPYVGQAKARELGLSGQIALSGPPVYAADIYIMFSKKTDAAVISRWADAVGEIRRSGELDRILGKYVTGSGS